MSLKKRKHAVDRNIAEGPSVRYEIQDSEHSSSLLVADGCRCCLKCPGVSGGTEKGNEQRERERISLGINLLSLCSL